VTPSHHTDAFSWLPKLRGRFIAFEGPDGSGKSTQFRRLLALCKEHGVTTCEVREPGGTTIGERVREILLDHAHHDMTLRCEMLLYMASRSQLVEQRIRPALARKELVLADRFVSSTFAYQGAAGGIPFKEIEDAATIALQGVEPHLVVIFDVDEVTAAKRINPLLQGDKHPHHPHDRDAKGPDRIEARGSEFHRKVRQGYLELARKDPSRHLVLDASKSPDEVWNELTTKLAARITK
jgi:dTMP kinase